MKRYLLIYDNDYYKVVEDDSLLLHPSAMPLVIIGLTDELINAIVGDKDE